MTKREEKEAERFARLRFETPMYGEVMQVGEVWEDIEGNTHMITDDGDKIVKRAK